MATNRPDTLDPALLRPGRMDRKVEFGLPDLEGRAQIFKIHSRSINCEKDIRFELLARLCPNSTGAEIRSVCTEAGIARRYLKRTVIGLHRGDKQGGQGACQVLCHAKVYGVQLSVPLQ